MQMQEPRHHNLLQSVRVLCFQTSAAFPLKLTFFLLSIFLPLPFCCDNYDFIVLQFLSDLCADDTSKYKHHVTTDSLSLCM